MVGRVKLGLFLVCVVFAGCGDMWGDLFGSKQGAGMLADGSTGPTCTRATHQELLSSLNTSCTLSGQCPSGAFCDIDVGGFCNFQCEASDDCPSTQVCNCLGQCVGDQPADGGVTADPACPRNPTLIAQVTSPSGKRSCKFDDICPYGTFCDDQSGTCAAECTSDSQCMAVDGAAQVCDCTGRCSVPGSKGPIARTNAPSLSVSPGLIELPLPTNLMVPVKPAFGPRQINVSLTSAIATVGMGNAINGPDVTIQVKASKYLNVECRVPCTSVNCETVSYTAPAKECTLHIQPDNWAPDKDSFVASHPVRVSPSSEQQASGEESLKHWTVSFQSADTAQTQSVVSVAYAARAPADAPLRDLLTSPAAINGGYTGYVEIDVRDRTASVNESTQIFAMKIPVYGIARGDHIQIYDPSMALSASGVVPVYQETVPHSGFFFLLSDAEIGETNTSMKINASVRTSEFFLDPNTQHISGSFQLKAEMVDHLSHGYIPVRFSMKPDIMPSCDPADTALTTIQCPAGTACYQGFCTNPVGGQIYSGSQFLHRQEAAWLETAIFRLHDAANGVGDGFAVEADRLLCTVGRYPVIGSMGINYFRNGAAYPQFAQRTVNGF